MFSAEKAASEIIRRKQIRTSLSKWAEHNGYIPARHHRLLIEHLEAVARGDIERLAVFMPPGSAKALALSTAIPTPSGWTQIGDLKVGDRVFDDRGLPCDVIRISEVWKDRPVYRVVTDCGDEIVADQDHEWLVRMCGKRDVFKLKKTFELDRPRRAKRVMITHAGALQLDPVELPIDPYLLGYWLGNGHSASPTLTSDINDKPFVRSRIEAAGYKTSDRASDLSFGVLEVRAKFVGFGLLNDPDHATVGKKYIPAVYLRAAVSQRLALLQGLIDSDGTINANGYVVFCNTNLELAKQTRELVRGLGVKATFREAPAFIGNKYCGPAYYVSFYLKDAASLPRKAVKCRDAERTPNTYIDVFPAGNADTICIEVNSPSHLFLAGRSMTPTHNSTYASILFPSWLLSQDPKALFLAASHTTELAERWGRRVRNLILENAAILKIALSETEAAAGRWALQEGGEYMAAGANVGIAGFRAKYGLIDDPIRSRQDADSVLVRDRIWDWYLNDFRPRLIPHARQVLIQTRWHCDDLAARCLNHQPWTVLSLPAFAKADDQLGRSVDEALWSDDDYGYGEQLVALRDTTPPRVWSALYQQSPAPDEGDFFKEEWLRPIDIMPDHKWMRTYGASDYAVTADGGDYTVHVVFGVDAVNNLYLLDIWRGQKSSDVWVEALCDLIAKYRPLAWAEEGGQIKSGIGPFLTKRMQERRVYVNREQFPTRGDKAVRARSIQGRMALDGLYYPKRAPWAADWLAEVLNFPASKHDDQVDSMGLAGQLLDKMVKGRAGQPQSVKLPDDGYRKRERNTVDAMTL